MFLFCSRGVKSREPRFIPEISLMDFSIAISLLCVAAGTAHKARR
jgi:hypothetical protein